MEKKARVKYCEDFRGEEGYVIEILIDGEWDLYSFYPLVRREGAKEDEEKKFVHLALINRILELQTLGYTIV